VTRRFLECHAQIAFVFWVHSIQFLERKPGPAGEAAHYETAPESSRRPYTGTVANKRRETRPAAKLTGTYVGHVRGFGFFVPSSGGDDLFVPPGHEGEAIDGDTVEVQPGRGDTVRVKQVLARNRRRLVGTFLGDGTFLPDAHHVGKSLEVAGQARRGDKVLVTASIDGFRVDRVLGRAGAPEVEDAAVVAELDLETSFSKAVQREVADLHEDAGDELRHRLDLRTATTVVTIDPLTSRDFDDAISVERRGGGWELGVHIADVSHYVRPGTAVDQEARRRATSVYFPGRVVPMLPERLSNDLCSLREGRDRLTLSVLLAYDGDGDLRRVRFARSVIRPRRRFSYERASRVMDGSRRETGRVGTVLRDMLELAEKLRKRRRSLELARGDAELVFDAAGNVVDVRSVAKDVAHGVIEEFMLAANQQVARLMLARGVPTLYRHHPRPEDLSHVWQTLELLGVDRARRLGLRRAISKALRMGFGPAVSAAVFRCLPRARYTSAEVGHFSLDFDAYLHFTSPIRRYADLTVHRALHALLEGRRKQLSLEPEAGLQAPLQDAHLDQLAAHINARAAAADRAESRVRRQRVLAFLLRQGAIPTTGQVTGVVERGLFVDLTEYGASGFLSIDALPAGDWRFEPGRLIGDRTMFRLGEEIEVSIHRIDPSAGQLDLVLAPRAGG
jgi:ribonuclease R